MIAKILVLILFIVSIVLPYVFAIVHLKKSEMTPMEKAAWVFIMLLFPLLGAISLLIIKPEPVGHKNLARYSSPIDINS